MGTTSTDMLDAEQAQQLNNVLSDINQLANAALITTEDDTNNGDVDDGEHGDTSTSRPSAEDVQKLEDATANLHALVTGADSLTTSQLTSSVLGLVSSAVDTVGQNAKFMSTTAQQQLADTVNALANVRLCLETEIICS